MVDWRVKFKPEELTTEGALKRTLAVVEQMARHMDRQDERISALTDVVYELAPEYEIIDAMAESPEERQEMLGRYMNHNFDYLTEAD